MKMAQLEGGWQKQERTWGQARWILRTICCDPCPPPPPSRSAVTSAGAGMGKGAWPFKRRPPVRVAAECGLVMPRLLDRCAPEAGPARVALGPWPETVAGAAPALRVGGNPAPGEQWGRPSGRSARWQKRLVGRWPEGVPAGWARGRARAFVRVLDFIVRDRPATVPSLTLRAEGEGLVVVVVVGGSTCRKVPLGMSRGWGAFPSQGSARTCRGSRLAATDLLPGDPLLSPISRAWVALKSLKDWGVPCWAWHL